MIASNPNPRCNMDKNFDKDFMLGLPWTAGGRHRAWLDSIGKKSGDPGRGGRGGGGFNASDWLGLVLVVVFLGWYFSPNRARQPAETSTPSVTPRAVAPERPPVSASVPFDAGPRSKTDDGARTPIDSTPAESAGQPRTARDAPAALVLRAKHKHRMRDCEGALTLFPDRIQFDSDEPKDRFTFLIEEVMLDDDGIKDRSGKPWHFVIEGRDVEETLLQWKAGRLPFDEP
jgi:hypothetical protein